MHFKRLGIYSQMLILFITTIILPIMVISAFSIFSIRNQYVQSIQVLVNQLMSSLSDQISVLYTGVETSTLRLSKNVSVVDFAENRYSTPYERYHLINEIEKGIELQSLLSMSPYIHSVYIIASDGSYYAKYGLDGWRFGEETADVFVDRVQRAEIGRDYGILMQVADMRTPATASQMTLVRKIASENGEEHGGQIAVLLNFSRLVNDMQSLSEEETCICITNGHMLAFCSNPEWESSDVLHWERTFTGESGNFLASVRGADYYVEYMREVASGWHIYLAFPQEYILPTSNMDYKIIIAMAMSALLLTTVIFFFFFRSITRPMVAIGKALTGFSPENSQALSIRGGCKELYQLVECYNVMVSHVANLVQIMMESERQKRIYEVDINKAQLQALQMQINPHFLSNTLSVINTYAMLEHQDSICRMIDALANMLRYAMQNPLELTPVKDEIAHVKEYLTILSYRRANMPDVVWKTHDVESLRIMRVTLQPLVGNAFQHAFLPEQRDARILIDIHREGEFVVISIQDNGQGITGCPAEFSPSAESVRGMMGIGLNNVSRRLQILFGSESGIVIRSRQGMGTEVIVRQPYVVEEGSMDR